MIVPSYIPSPEDQLAAQAAMRHVWRASELSRGRVMSVPTGHAVLDAQLPDGGWPQSSLVELLLQQSGIGEMHLLRHALAALSQRRRVALIQPPYRPNAAACRFLDLSGAHLLWVRAASTADALWSAEQILRNGGCGAVLLWQKNIRSEALRRLNLAAQSADTVFFLLRPMSAAADSSPAPLRIALRPAAGGISAHIIKRRGPHHDDALFIPLASMPARQRFLNDAVLAQRPSSPIAARIHTAALV